MHAEFNGRKNRGAQSWGPAMIRGARPSEGELRRGDADAATCCRPPAPERPRMRLVSWKPLIKGALRGFLTFELPLDLKPIDCPLLIGTERIVGESALQTSSRPQGKACQVRRQAAVYACCNGAAASLAIVSRGSSRAGPSSAFRRLQG
jgi:hypothetical protein